MRKLTTFVRLVALASVFTGCANESEIDTVSFDDVTEELYAEDSGNGYDDEPLIRQELG
jgi:hypothetical protein